MRTFKSIIVRSANLKNMFPSIIDESSLILQAILNCNLPKLKLKDIPIFMAITKDLFPNVTLTQLQNIPLQEAINNIAQIHSLELSEVTF